MWEISMNQIQKQREQSQVVPETAGAAGGVAQLDAQEEEEKTIQ